MGLVLTLTSVLSWVPWLPETARNAPSWTQRAMFWAGLLGTVCGGVGLTLAALVQRSWGILRAAALTLSAC